MFESEIIDMIAAIPESSLLSTYRGRPAVFSGMGPEDIPFPYVVIDIGELNPPDSIITRFLIEINVFDFGTSESNVRRIAFSISNALDNQLIQSERFADIRIRRGTRNRIDVPDPRGIQYYLTFEARGSREYWTKSIL